MKNHQRSHPWHGVSLGCSAPKIITCYIEMVPTDTVKYEIDKETGILKVDRPQKYSSLCPALYGLLPQTYSGPLTAKHCAKKVGREKIVGDRDPIDVCVLTEHSFPRGDLLLSAIPIGGFRLLDGEEADDKIISVLVGDFIYGDIKELSQLPSQVVERLRHYFLTYKDSPQREASKVEIVELYGAEEAMRVIEIGCKDYAEKFKRERE